MVPYSKLRSALWLFTGYPGQQYGRVLTLSRHWSREQVENFRNEKLKKLISHCYEHVPYYRRVMKDRKIVPQDIRSAEDLDCLPLLTKEIVRTHAGELRDPNIPPATLSWTKTGGTTGEPMHIGKNQECVAWANMCHERGLAWGGLSPDEPRVNLFGGSLGVEKTGLMTRLGGLLRQDLFLPAFELRTDTAGSFFEKIRGSQSRFLLGYTSAVYRLAVLAEEMHQELAFEAVFPTAELLLPQWKEVIERVFHCAVLPYYGCGEVNALGYQVRGADHYYIPEEHALIEVWEKDGSTRLCGEGSFVITDLDNYAMPFLRYVNGDAGKISCAQGEVPLSRIERLDGRYNSLLMTDTGELISGAIGPHIFRHVPSVQIYRIIQEEPLRIVIKIVPKSDFSEEDRRLIINLLGRHLGSNMKITIEKVPDLPVPPSGKSVFVINHCLSSPAPF